MLQPGGHFLIVTPFLYKVHPNPYDCTRWTETGMRYFLAECGFPLDPITTGSWGNRACLEATLRREYRLFNRLRAFLEERRGPADGGLGAGPEMIGGIRLSPD